MKYMYCKVCSTVCKCCLFAVYTSIIFQRSKFWLYEICIRILGMSVYYDLIFITEKAYLNCNVIDYTKTTKASRNRPKEFTTLSICTVGLEFTICVKKFSSLPSSHWNNVRPSNTLKYWTNIIILNAFTEPSIDLKKIKLQFKVKMSTMIRL